MTRVSEPDFFVTNGYRKGITHRNVPIVAVILACISLLPLSSRQVPNVVQIDSGLVSGRTDSHGVTSYLGIPFAASPVGSLRWRPPQPVAAWKGVRPANRFGPSCMQDEMGIRLPWSRGFMTQGPISEDCLYLNVWTTSPATPRKLPVMVYIYGGGFSEGSSEVAVYNGEALATKGVVVVTFNYRVGPLGFLAYPGLSKESPHHSSGNYGLLDQIAALRWVHRNIIAFGGNSANVTIFGQSAGAMSVGDLMRSPLAKGLFAHAIAQSGLGLFPSSVRGRFHLMLAQAEQHGLKYAEARGAHSLAQLRAIPAADFAKPIPGTQPGLFGFGPNADNWVIPESAPAPAREVPLIDGMVAGDTMFASGFGFVPPKTVVAYKTAVKKIYGPMAAEFLKLYPVKRDEDVPGAIQASGVDRARVSIYLWGTGQAKRGPLYTYYFDHPEPWPQHPEFGTFHTSEVPYIFETLSVLHRSWQPLDFKISREMSYYWTNFAKKGNPNGPGLAHWPEFNVNSRTTMQLGSRMGPMPIASRAKLNFFLGYFNK